MKDILYIFPPHRRDLEIEVKKNKSPDNALYGENYMRQYGYSTDIAYVSPLAEKILDIIFSPLHRIFRSQIDIDFKLGRALLLLPVINKYKVIVTNTDGINLAICFLRRLKLIKIPVIYAVGLFYIRGSLEKSLKYNRESIFLKFYKWILKGADHTIYHAPIEKEKLLKLGFYNPVKCTFIAMGSDGQFFSNKSKAPEVENLIVSVGKDRARDYKILIETAKKLRNFKFVIICRKQNLRGLIFPSNVQTFFDVSYLEVTKWYQKAAISVIPIKEMNRSSGQMTLTDAIQASKPLIISDVVGIVHYNLQNGKDLIKVKPESVDELTSAIKGLSGSKTLREKFKKRAGILAKIYNTKNYARQIAKVVASVLDPVKVEPIAKQDLDFLREGRNESLESFLDSRFVTEESQAKWYKSYLKSKDEYMLLLTINGLRVGAGSIYKINQTDKIAEIGRFFIKSEFRNRGYGKKLLSKIEDIAINELKIKTLKLRVISKNIAANNLYKESGFQIKGFEKIEKNVVATMTKTISN